MDEYGTAAIRERVLAAWAASPARFREDANAEEDHTRGGYRDRVVVELAQNAADAATRAGVPGRVRFELRDGVLTAANTGAPLDAAGVEALSTLRASSKRDDTMSVGRFGVGFAAVVAISDTPSITTRPPAPGGEDRHHADGPHLPGSAVPDPGTGGFHGERGSRIRAVGWSAERTREAVAGVPVLVAEVERRGGVVPVLRLPFEVPVPQDLPEGFTTVVRLPLRDADAEALVRRLLRETGPALMLALPALAEIVVDTGDDVHTLTAAWDSHGVTINGTRWRTAEAHGEVDASLLADRPVEERPYWQVRWAVTDDPQPDDVPALVHAPTPSDEPLGLPALLIASFPLAPDRRHVAPGPLTDFLVERAAEAYVGLLPPTPHLLDLVPGPIAKGELDARIRRAILGRLPDTPLLPMTPDTRPS